MTMPVTTFAGERVALADLLDVRRNLAVQGDGGAHPLGGIRIGAELLRMAKARVLVGDTLPHIPAATGLQVWVPCGGRVLGPHGGVLHATAVGDEHQIVLGQVDGGFITLVIHVDAHGKLLGGRAGRVALEEAGGGLNLLDGVWPTPVCSRLGPAPTPIANSTFSTLVL